MRAVVLCVAAGLAGCGQMGKPGELERARECALATHLNATALDRFAKAEAIKPDDDAIVVSMFAAGRYRKLACAHDPDLAGK